MHDGEPILIVKYETQQVHCVRNKKGEIVEGSESEIRRIHYVWAMVRHFSEDLAEPPSWKLHRPPCLPPTWWLPPRMTEGEGPSAGGRRLPPPDAAFAARYAAIALAWSDLLA